MKELKHWPTDDDLREYLITTLHLPNADTIVQKVTLEGPITFAKGTRQLAYKAGKYYLYELEPEPDFGAGKALDTKALQARWQAQAPRAIVTVEATTYGCAIGIDEWERGNKIGLNIRLNIKQLRTAKQVREAIAYIDKQI
jgi:hypothetical protein